MKTVSLLIIYFRDCKNKIKQKQRQLIRDRRRRSRNESNQPENKPQQLELLVAVVPVIDVDGHRGDPRVEKTGRFLGRTSHILRSNLGRL